MTADPDQPFSLSCRRAVDTLFAEGEKRMPEEIGVLKAAYLGAIQGVTEFLPISSSGHLALMNILVGDSLDARSSTAFFVVLHLATLVAAVWVFRAELRLLMGPDFRTVPLLALATVPMGLLYLAVGDYIKAASTQLAVIGAGFLVTAGFLFLSERGWKEEKDHTRLGILDAVLIGAAQAIAMVPGISRSGLTISMARVRGSTRRGAATFSYLLSIPAIGGAAILEISALKDLPNVAEPRAIACGFLAAFVTGLVSLKLLLRVIRAGRFAWFAPYCTVLGLVTLVYAYSR